MTEKEEEACRCLLLPPDAGAPVEVIVIDEDDSSEGVMIKAKKQRIDTEKRKRSRYVKVGWIPCSARKVERLFFMCKRVRKALFFESMDVLLYLRANRHHWDRNTFRRAIRNWEQEQEMGELDEGFHFVQESDDEEEEKKEEDERE